MSSECDITVALAGNPNVGKSTLFNVLTGETAHVGNWPGVTVELKEGVREHRGNKICFVDLPGTYGISATSMEEIVAREFIISGGSALQPRLARVFWAARINVQEGYGLTETSPVIAVNKSAYPDIKFGTVGPIIEGVEVKFAEDGEILAKGPNLMMGYYKDEKYTKEVIDEDGWFHTGDIGRLEDDKFLKITDRKKEIFKNSAGKYIAPQMIENKMKESFFISQAMVVGENEKFVSALISPNFSFLHDWCSRYQIHFRDNKELVQIPKVIARYQKEISVVNKTLSQVEQVKRFRLVCEDWSTASGELSPTLKLKRKFIAEKYKSILENIFSRSADSETLDEVINKAKGKK